VIPFKGAYRVALIVAAIHLVLVAITAWYISAAEQESGQTVLIWVYWLFIDFPVSLLAYFLLDGRFFLAHAVIGTLWWFFLITVVTRIIQAVRERKRLRRQHGAL